MGDDQLATTIAEAADLSEAVHLAIRAASTCWENLDGAGVFQSERAHEIAVELIVWIRRDRTPRLGFATTEELIGELAARAEVSRINGEAWPSYRTVGE